MEDRENTAGTFDRGYDKLISQEDLRVEEDTFESSHGKQQVSMSMMRRESNLSYYKRLTVSLVVLAVILLAVDIGLGVYYNKLTSGQRTMMDISSVVAQLQASYNLAIQGRDEAKRELERELSDQQLTKWELEHQKKRSSDYTKQTDQIQMEIAGIKSHIPMIEEGCRHCLPGWTFLNSMCYYIPFSDAISRRPWQESRQFCTKQGADLATIDNREKHLALSKLITNNQNPTRPIFYSGFWIGLRDVEEEGTWKWLDGTRLIEGYWNRGEPNNQGGEDCVAMYPRDDPFKSWNDAPCSYDLKWICEMTPRAPREM